MSPRERVEKFCAAMTEWESKTFASMMANPGKQTAEELESARSLLSVIYDEHLTDKAKGPKNWGMRLPGPMSGSPPQYNQQVTGEEPGPRSTTYVFTKHQVLPNRAWRYSVVTEAGDARIDDMRIRKGESTEWKSEMY